MTESDLWKSIRTKLPSGLFFRRIEDSSGNLGTYDTFMALDGKSTWFDLKIAGPNAKPTLRPGQMAFGMECWNSGIPAYYVIGSDTGLLRLVDARTNGGDWRNHLVLSFPRVTGQAVVEVILAMTRGYTTQQNYALQNSGV